MANRYKSVLMLADDALAGPFYVEDTANNVGDLEVETPGLLIVPAVGAFTDVDNVVVTAQDGETGVVAQRLLIEDEALEYEGLRFRGGLAFGRDTGDVECDSEVLTLQLGPCVLTIERVFEETTATVTLAFEDQELEFTDVAAESGMQIDFSFVSNQAELSVWVSDEHYYGVIDEISIPATLVRHANEIRLQYKAVALTGEDFAEGLALLGPVAIDVIASPDA